MKTIRKIDPSNIPAPVKKALTLLTENGFRADVVGGAVRDTVMGKTPGDYDITTSALPEETEKVFSGMRVIETGIKHGTVTVIVDGMPLEITTYRIESEYLDCRHPENVSFTDDILEDLARRDFTCNAMAVSKDGTLTDPFGGINDIEGKVIRCVGNPHERFNEDALRILRALRFASCLGFEIHKDTKKAIADNYRLLDNISRERIFAETNRLLCGKNAEKILTEFDYVFFAIIPELKPMKNCRQNHERHIFDVWQHCVHAVSVTEPEPVLRFAALLHDVGKPSCKTTDEKGVDHFYSHGKAGALIAADILESLKVSNRFRKDVVTLIEYHDFVPDRISDKTYRKYLGLLGRETMENLFALREADVRSQNPLFLEESLASNKIGFDRFTAIAEKENCFSLKDLAVNGRDLIDYGLREGPEIKEKLEMILDAVLSGKIPNNRPAILAFLQNTNHEVKND